MSTQPDRLKCRFCTIQYNETDHLPKILINCGHTICSTCLNEINSSQVRPKCPFGCGTTSIPKRNIAHVPTNRAILELLEWKNDKCSTHKETKQWICLNDYTEICEYCIKYGSHRGHTVRLMKEIQDKADKKKEEYRSQLNMINAEFKVAEIEVESAIQSIQDHFKRLRELLTNQESEIQSDISRAFDQERFSADIQEIKNQGTGVLSESQSQGFASFLEDFKNSIELCMNDIENSIKMLTVRSEK